MSKKPWHLLVVILLLAAGALACNTVTGGGVRDLTEDDIQATADALGLDTDAQATIAAAETAAADIIGDTDGDTGTDDNGNSDDNGNTDDNGNPDDNGSTDNPFEGQGPENIPVLDDNAELVFADDSSLTYYTDASFDDSVDFYREEMINAGWEASANGDNVFGQIASLQYERDGATALVAVTVDPTSNRTLVAVTVTQ
ncbi:MAG: hypothetical protein IT317_10150 [Anaerolineales bacterium]|nr:hypothetical protein [Anaerolineales bacterium]